MKVLDWCNGIRKKLSLKPVDELKPGYVGNPFGCPIARTIGYKSKKVISVGIDGSVHSKGRLFAAPKFVTTFVRKFDNGRAPKKYYLDETEHEN